MKKLNFGIYIIKKMPELKLEDILSGYKGKPHMCMCGCSGRYFYTKANQKESGKNRGYEINDKEVNDKKVLEILRIMSEGDNIEVIDSTDDSYIFTKIVNDKQFTIYTN